MRRNFRDADNEIVEYHMSRWFADNLVNLKKLGRALLFPENGAKIYNSHVCCMEIKFTPGVPVSHVLLYPLCH